LPYSWDLSQIKGNTVTNIRHETIINFIKSGNIEKQKLTGLKLGKKENTRDMYRVESH